MKLAEFLKKPVESNGDSATRDETVDFQFVLDAVHARRHADSVALLNRGWVPRIEFGDKLNLSYRINIHYFGEVERALNAIERLIDDPDVVKNCGLREIVHGSCLFLRVSTKLKNLSEKLSRRKAR